MKVFAMAVNTFKETVRQPAVFILVIIGALLVVVSSKVPLFLERVEEGDAPQEDEVKDEVVELRGMPWNAVLERSESDGPRAVPLVAVAASVQETPYTGDGGAKDQWPDACVGHEPAGNALPPRKKEDGDDPADAAAVIREPSLVYLERVEGIFGVVAAGEQDVHDPGADDAEDDYVNHLVQEVFRLEARLLPVPDEQQESGEK